MATTASAGAVALSATARSTTAGGSILRRWDRIVGGGACPGRQRHGSLLGGRPVSVVSSAACVTGACARSAVVAGRRHSRIAACNVAATSHPVAADCMARPRRHSGPDEHLVACRARGRPRHVRHRGTRGGQVRWTALFERQPARHHPAAVRARLQLPRRRTARPIRDAAVLARIRALAIPPAWTDVWICPDPAGHLQATGRDARRTKAVPLPRPLAGRPRRCQVRAADRLRGGASRGSARRCDADLARPGLPREKVLAAVVRLLETTLIRVGNDEYARLNRSFGLTTMRGRHVRVDGTTDPLPVPRQVGPAPRGRPARPSPGERSSGAARTCRARSCSSTSATMANRTTSPPTTSTPTCARSAAADVTAKDFRTWAGTVLAYRALRALRPSRGRPGGTAQRGRGGP